VSETSDETDPLVDPPAVGDGEEPAGSGDFDELLQSFEGEADLDDSVSEELDAGVALDDDELPVGDEVGPLLDIGEMVQSREEEEPSGMDDLGPEGEPGFGLFDDGGAAEWGDDDAEGAVERDDLISEDLPGLADAADDAEEGALADEAEELFGAGEEDPPRHAELRWLDLPPLESPACSVVRFSTGRLIAGGERVVAHEDEGASKVLAEGVGEVVEALLVDGDDAFFATGAGRLFRVVGGAPPEALTLGDVPLSRGTSTRVELGGPTQATRPAVLVRVESGGGTLLESTDRGTTFRRVELGGHVLALSTGIPAVCVVELEGGPRLFRSEASGGFRKVSGDLGVETEAPLLASDGDIIAALERGAGVKVSADGGATFRRVVGSARATAVAAGRLGGRPSAFAALFDASSGHTSIVWIDATSADARVVAELTAGPDQEDDLDDWTKIVSLAWDSAGETLWAAGSFGLRGFRRPPSA
jgi:hypothetical protein